MRYCITPAPSRHATIPTARSRATPTNSARTATRPPAGTSPLSKAGSTTWSVAQPRTQASATVSAPNSRLPSVDNVKIHGSRRIATPRTAKPSRRVPSPFLTRTTLRSGHDPDVPDRTQRALRPRVAGRRRPADPLRGLVRQGPRRAPAGPGDEPGRGRDRRPAAGRADRVGLPAGPPPRLRGPRREAPQRTAAALAVRRPEGGDGGEHGGVLRAPRGHPACPARVGAAHAGRRGGEAALVDGAYGGQADDPQGPGGRHDREQRDRLPGRAQGRRPDGGRARAAERGD